MLNSFKFYGKITKRKPFISMINQKEREAFAKGYLPHQEPPEFWKNGIFSDESKFDVFGSDSCRYVWRKSNTEFEVKNVRSTLSIL